MRLDVTKYILFLNNESKRLKKFIDVRLPEIKMSALPLKMKSNSSSIR